jgi:ABC-type lipoprotein export system ATPase subunit
VIPLQAHALSKSVVLPSGERLRLVRSVGLAVGAGESVAIVGRSGSGKSTLLALLGLLSPPDAGTLSINDRDCSTLNDRELSKLRNRNLGFVFQNYSLLGHLNAAENVALPLLQGSKLRRAEIRRLTNDALAAVGLLDRAHSRPRHLSGGEQQRVAIARALVWSPTVILADEPTGALDIATAEQVLTTLVDAAIQHNAALVLVTHDPLVAERADRVLRLESGTLVEERR